MVVSREISNFERGMLVGIPIGAIAGPSVALVLFVLIVCYDLGRPRIVDVGQKLLDKYIGLDIISSASGGVDKEPTTNISDEERNMLSQLLAKLSGVNGGNKTPYRLDDGKDPS